MSRSALRAVIELLRGQRSLLLRFAVTSLGRTAMAMASVLLIREFLFAVLQQQGGLVAAVAERAGRETALWGVALLLVCSYVGSSLFDYDNQIVRQRMVKVVELGLMDRLVRHLLSLSVGFFDRTSRGDLLHAIRQDVADLRVICLSGATIVMESAVAAGLLVAAVWISPGLAFWALFVLPIGALPLVAIARHTRARSFAERRSGYVVFDVILQILRGIRIIKIYQGEAQEARTTIDAARRYFDEQIRLVRIRELSNVVLESLAGLSVAAVIIVGGLKVMHGALDWPQLLAFLMAVRTLHGPLDHINTDLMLIQRHRAAAQRIAALMREQPDVCEAPDARPLPGPARRITLSDVCFRYGERLVLDSVSLDAEANNVGRQRS